MDSLDNTFGLTLTTGHAGSERAWADFVRLLGVPDSQVQDTAAVARALESARPETAASLAALLDEVSDPADSVAARISDMLLRAGPTVLLRVLQQMEMFDRKRAVQNAARAISPRALVPLVEATSQTFGAPMSQQLLELVRKLALNAETFPDGARVTADHAFRSLVDHLIERWSESQVNAGLTSFADLFGDGTRPRAAIIPEAIRVVALSLETGSVGTVVWTAVKEQSRTEKGVRELISMITRAPAGRATDMISEQLITPARLTALLHEDPIDFDAVDVCVRHLGLAAAKPLLDELVESQNRSTRRAIMDRLVAIGSDIGPVVQERLTDSRWYVVRNMISLLRECYCEFDHSLLDRFAVHDDARVRREMLQLRMENPAMRANALVAALLDRDKGVLRAALQAARANLPPAAVPTLAKRVVESDFPPEFRVMSLYLLGKSGNVAALDALIAFASGGKTLLGKARLAPKTPEMLAALSGLARSWPNDRRAAELINVASKSKDEQIVAALNAVGGGE